MRIFQSHIWCFSLLVSCAFLLSCQSPRQPSANGRATPAQPPLGNTSLKLTSPAFNEGEMIPRKYTCAGENVSPPLLWSGVPANTKSLALIVDDPDAPGKTWVHWVVYDLPPDLNSVPENFASTDRLPGTARQGTNDFQKIFYGGPCPPAGTHRYNFRLYALDRQSSLPNSGATKDQLVAVMQGHILAEGHLMGRYSH